LRSSRPRSVRYSAAYLVCLAFVVILTCFLIPSSTSHPPSTPVLDASKRTEDTDQIKAEITQAACPHPNHLGLDQERGDLICSPEPFVPNTQASVRQQ
jgi:hypothetical protein